MGSRSTYVLFAGISVVALMQLLFHSTALQARPGTRRAAEEEEITKAANELRATVKATAKLLKHSGRSSSVTSNKHSGHHTHGKGAAEKGPSSEKVHHHHHHHHASKHARSEDSGADTKAEGAKIDVAAINADSVLTPEEVKGLTLDEALIIYKKKLSLHLEDNCKDNKDYQSSKHFHDFKAPKHGGWNIPDANPSDEKGPCDPTLYSPSEAQRADCEGFMSDFANWKQLRPMDSVLRKARTIKFMVQTTDPDVKLILKLPQFKFLVEPYSEYAAYESDKIFGTNRVPTTVWVPVPLNWLRAAAATLMPAMYSQWVDCYIFSNDHIKKTFGDDKEHGQVVYLSAQLWMKGVQELASTSLKLSSHRVEELLDPATEKAAGDDLEQWAIEETSDLFVFDHVIGNKDRSLVKNAFAVGTCGTDHWVCKGKDHRHYPHMVFLDQGSSMYSAHAVSTSRFGTSSKMCRFRRHTFHVITDMAKDKYLDSLKELAPSKGFWGGFQEWQIGGAEKRRRSLAKHMEQCREKHGSEIFLD